MVPDSEALSGHSMDRRNNASSSSIEQSMPLSELSSARFRGKPHEDVQAYWADAESFRFQRTPIQANMKREGTLQDGRDELFAQLEQAQELEIKQLEDELDDPVAKPAGWEMLEARLPASVLSCLKDYQAN
ncbi:hypothetical protein N0V83_009014 [Neocucurbitaria cava]|uniref:Uncharacterized protein n=1 Tax=Neocucurbitaria cava TaxID=798079 RepID=A0A9W8Y362_9PLEO|nr:hypothetical protein N0V83_009014 [Neocucurbitaria cava]